MLQSVPEVKRSAYFRTTAVLSNDPYITHAMELNNVAVVRAQRLPGENRKRLLTTRNSRSLFPGQGNNFHHCHGFIEANRKLAFSTNGTIQLIPDGIHIDF